MKSGELFYDAVDTYPTLATTVRQRCLDRCRELGVTPQAKFNDYIDVLAGSSPELKASHNKNISAEKVQKGFGKKGNGSSARNLPSILSKNPRYEKATQEEQSSLINQ